MNRTDEMNGGEQNIINIEIKDDNTSADNGIIISDSLINIDYDEHLSQYFDILKRMTKRLDELSLMLRDVVNIKYCVSESLHIKSQLLLLMNKLKTELSDYKLVLEQYKQDKRKFQKQSSVVGNIQMKISRLYNLVDFIENLISLCDNIVYSSKQVIDLYKLL